MQRRDFIKLAGCAALSSTLSTRSLFAATPPHIVIIGGGVGGATTAKYLRLMDANVRVTLIEKNPVYIRPYGSSEVINGHIGMKDLEVTYTALKDKYGVNVVIDEAIGFDPDKQLVKLWQGGSIHYDRLVVSPGIELLYGQVPGYSKTLADKKIPSGWIPGQQTRLLREQLLAMPQGGTFLIAAPPAPYRCPPGPYERGALVAEWCQKHNPTAKVIITDPKNKFVTDQTMMLGWHRRYGFNIPPEFMEGMPEDVNNTGKPGMLEWIPEKDGGKIMALDAENMTVETEGSDIKADVINIIPPMRAGIVAQKMGLTNEQGWCPVNHYSFESELHPKVHVLGDASVSNMPKSGFAANTQAKVIAKAIIDLLAGREPDSPTLENVCYAVAGRDYGIFVADVFKLNDKGRIARQSMPRYAPLDATEVQLRLGEIYQQTWMKTFTEDCFA